jgi:hypothetical protein
VEQHQRQQPARRRAVRHELAQQPREADRIGGELAPYQRIARRRRIAFVEYEVDHGHHSGKPFGELVFVGHPVGDARHADLVFCPHQPLGHRRRRDEEGTRDLLRRQPAERPKRQRHLRLHRQRRVAAGEDQPQPVV